MHWLRTSLRRRTGRKDVDRPDATARRDTIGEQRETLVGKLQKAVVGRLDMVSIHDQQRQPTGVPNHVTNVRRQRKK